MKSPAVPAAAWRGSTPTTPQRSPQRARSSGSVGISVGAHATRSLSAMLTPSLAGAVPQQQKQKQVALPDMRSRSRGPPLVPPTTTTTTAAAASQRPQPQWAATARQQQLPLHEQPAFRADLVHRSVFVFGLRTVEECRALLHVLQTQCGPVAGAFRTADHALGSSNGGGAAAAAGGAGAMGGVVVICVVFYRADSATVARRLDNTAQVYQNRFVVESAARFQYMSHSPALHASSFGSPQAAELPQHVRLWQLLFSPTHGGAEIDWRAAAAAVERGEALLLRSAAVTTGSGSSSSSSGGANAGDRSSVMDAAGNSRSARSGADVADGEPSHRFDAAVTSPPSATPPAARLNMDGLGRSNTLQQQYYTDRYEATGEPILSSLSRAASSVLHTAFGGVRRSSSLMGMGSSYDDAHLPLPLRQRVEGGAEHQGCESGAAAAANASAAPSGEGGAHAAGDRSGDGGVYIPRMRSIGDYIVAAVPFAASFLAPLFREGGDDVSATAPGRSSNATTATATTTLAGDFSGGFLPEGRTPMRRKRQRYGDDALAAPSAGYAGAAAEHLHGMGEVFSSLRPDLLSASFAAPMRSSSSFAGAAALSALSARGALPHLLIPPFIAAHRAANSTTTTNTTTGSSSSSSSTVRATATLGGTISAAASNDDVRAYVTEHVRLRPLHKQREDTVQAPPPLPAAPTPWATPSSQEESSFSSRGLGRLLRHARALYDAL